MITSRAGLTAIRPGKSLRRHFICPRNQRPLLLSKTMVLQSVTGPSALFTAQAVRASCAPLQTSRPVTSQPLKSSEAQTILAQQRLNRPVSPHLEIYDKKQTFLTSSIWQRFTGGFLTGGLYAYSIGYLVAPLAGWHLESASIAAAFSTLPVAVKGGVKMVLVWPFMYHGVNGVKFLLQDATARGFNKATIKRNDMAVWGASTLFAAVVVFLL